MITSLIKGDRTKSKGWMFDIVANKRNNLDVDKFDYLHRDTKSLGIDGGGFDHKRLIIHSKIIND